MIRGKLAVAAMVLVAVAPPPARGNARAETEEARIANILQSALVKHGGDVNRCFEKALADTLDVSGKIELAVDVGENGRVTKAAPASDGVKSPVLLACLTESAATWTLAGIDRGSTVIVPLAFEGQAAQFSVKVKDAPDHGFPAPPPSKKAGAPAPVPMFSVKLLVDEATMRAQKAALTQLTIGPANRIAMHKHPGAEVLYVLKGHARVLGPTGVAPEKLDEGMAVLIPGGMPHAIENMGRTSSAVLLDVFAPMGPERVYRDPKDPAGRAAFEVIRGAAPAAPAGTKFTVASAGDVLPVFGGKGNVKIKPLLEPAKTGNKALYVGILEADPGAEVPRNSHPGSAEILYVVSGSGVVTIGSEKLGFGAEEALHIPDGQPHAAKFTGPEKTIMVQVFAPAGPEERYRAAQAAGKPAKTK